jgi:hypothetical protein
MPTAFDFARAIIRHTDDVTARTRKVDSIVLEATAYAGGFVAQPPITTVHVFFSTSNRCNTAKQRASPHNNNRAIDKVALVHV